MVDHQDLLKQLEQASGSIADLKNEIMHADLGNLTFIRKTNAIFDQAISCSSATLWDQDETTQALKEEVGELAAKLKLTLRQAALQAVLTPEKPRKLRLRMISDMVDLNLALDGLYRYGLSLRQLSGLFVAAKPALDRSYHSTEREQAI